jgi:hypothetical protein
MIVYNVTCTLVDEHIHDEWVQWMKHTHIPEVMETGLFTDYRMLRLLNEENNGITYAVQYRCTTLAEYRLYQKEYAPALQQKTREKYGEKVLAFRTLLEEV